MWSDLVNRSRGQRVVLWAICQIALQRRAVQPGVARKLDDWITEVRHIRPIIKGAIMKTPAGKECRFYYENFHRGRSDQECRLIMANLRSPAWRPNDCSQCPVPEILAANSNPNLVLEATVKKGVLGLVGRRVTVHAFCSKHLVDVPEPQAGCRQCAEERPGLRELLR